MEEAVSRGSEGSEMFVAAITVVVLTVLCLALFSRFGRKARRLPPGPKGWPVVGSLLEIGFVAPHRNFAKLAKEYGPIMCLQMGSEKTVVITSPGMAKEVLKIQDQIWASRPKQIMPSYLSYGKNIVFTEYGPHWRNVRKFCTLELFTTNRILQFQAVRQREVLATLQYILDASREGSIVNIQDTTFRLATNTMTQMMWNKKYLVAKGGSMSAEAMEFLKLLREQSALVGAVNIADYIPALKPITMNFQGYNRRMTAVHEKMDRFLENIIEEQRKTAEGNVSRNFVDVLLQSKQPESDCEEPLSMDTIKAILWDMIIAGTKTNATTIEWGLAELIRHPEMMRKVQEELDTVVGHERLVSEADIPNLKYFQAVVKEAFRLHPPGPLGVAHKSTQDCDISGYHVPKGTQAVINIWAIHRDPAVWERPLEFDPERFLSSTMDMRGTHFELIPFGSGRRMCPGINLGLAVVHSTLAQLLHAFSWTLPGADLDPLNFRDLDMAEKFGLVMPKAVPLSVFATPRLPADVIIGVTKCAYP